MYHFHNFGQSLKFRGGPTVGRGVERGAQLGGKGLIAFRDRVRTNTTEVSTGWNLSRPSVFLRLCSVFIYRMYPNKCPSSYFLPCPLNLQGMGDQ